MQRIFNGRYLFLAVALLAVWMLGKTQLTHPPTDASWSEIAASELVVGQAKPPQAIEPKESCDVCPQQAELALDQEAAIEWAEEFSYPDELKTNVLPDATGNQIALDIAEPGNAKADSEALPLEAVETLFVATNELNDATVVETAPPTTELVNDLSTRPQQEANIVNDVGSIRPKAIDSEDRGARKPTAWQKNPFADQTNEPQTSPSNGHSSIRTSFQTPPNSVLDQVSSEQQPLRSVKASSQSASAQPPEAAPTTVGVTDSVAQQAAHHIEYGKSLSRRGASYCARQEFFAALGVVARGNDAQVGGNAYSTALRRAVQALREVGDFAVTDAETQIGMNLADILETHQTQIIAPRDAIKMTPVEAMQRYFTFAHQQLDFAGGRNVVVAEAMFCLGKLHTVMAKHQPETLDIAKAIVFHRSALLSNRANFRSANELGVLLARSGKLSDAAELMKQSLQIRPSAETWKNLAKVHERQGDSQMAQLARSEFTVASQMDNTSSESPRIQWLPQQAFNQVGPADFHDSAIPAIATGDDAIQPASRTAAIEPEEKGSKIKSFAERLNIKKWF